jgi:hypothetical protein
MRNIGFVLVAIGLLQLGIGAAMVALHRRGKAFTGDPRKIPLYRAMVWGTRVLGAIAMVGGCLVIALAK